MRQHLGCSLFLSAVTLMPLCYAATDQPNKTLKRAESLSSLTGAGAEPFQVKLTVSEPANPNSTYTATIEEYWQSDKHWRRSIESPGFRQTVLVEDGKRTEQNIGDYYPIWLRSFVTAAIDPLEDRLFWEKVSARMVETTTTGGRVSSSCARAQFKVGTPTLDNDGFAVICFNADGTLSSVVRPGYNMEFHDPHKFGKKRIAYQYVDDPQPGTNLIGQIEILESISSISSEPAVSALEGQSSGAIRSVPIKQEMFESLLTVPEKLSWPTVHSGSTNGKLSMYVSADRSGHIREAYPLNSDNAGLQNAARDQLLKWVLRPATVDGQRVQTEAALTFSFSTTLDQPASTSDGSSSSSPISTPSSNPIRVSKATSSALRVKFYAPVYPQELKERRIGGKVDFTAIIGKDGHVVSLTPIQSTDPRFTRAAIPAVQQWVFKPYLLNGAPVEIETPISVIFDAP